MKMREIKTRCIHVAAGWLSEKSNFDKNHSFLLRINWRLCSQGRLLSDEELAGTKYPAGSSETLMVNSVYKRDGYGRLVRVDCIMRLIVHERSERIVHAEWEREPDLKDWQPPPPPESYGEWS